MAYPSTLPIDPKESHRIVRDGRKSDIIGDGVARVRKLHADKYDFELKHPMLTSSEFSTWTTFYNTNSLAVTFDFVWPEDGVTYQVRFGENAFRSRWKSPTRRDLWVRLVAA
jgi:hypothetical protein